MSASNSVSRRTVLATGGLTALGAGVVLTGCSAASSSKAAANSATTPATSTSAPSPATSASSTDAGATDSPTTGAASSSAAPTGTAVAKLSDIPVGGSISATLSGKPILLAQPTAGAVVGFSAICTHQGCTVAPAGKQFDCPCHGSEYDAATGAVLRGPAPTPLAKLTVTVSAGSVLASAG